jgi:AcrR family transcriptional regulator
MRTRIRTSPRSRIGRAVTPRKTPSQSRAEATVEAILCAAAHILAAKGWEAVNTNRIAGEAGVSVGSLYQYFPGRDAILAELGRRHAFNVVGATRDALERTKDKPFVSAMREVIRAAIRLHESDSALHRAIEDETPRLGPLDWREGAYGEIQRILCDMLFQRRDELDVEDDSFTAFLAATIVEGVVHAAMVSKPVELRNGRVEAELIRILRTILRARWR